MQQSGVESLDKWPRPDFEQTTTAQNRRAAASAHGLLDSAFKSPFKRFRLLFEYIKYRRSLVMHCSESICNCDMSECPRNAKIGT